MKIVAKCVWENPFVLVRLTNLDWFEITGFFWYEITNLKAVKITINGVILTFLFGCLLVNGSVNKFFLSKNDQYFWLK